MKKDPKKDAILLSSQRCLKQFFNGSLILLKKLLQLRRESILKKSRKTLHFQ